MANVGKGAASGAALGSAISPGLGTIIGGIGGAAISAIGSFFFFQAEGGMRGSET